MKVSKTVALAASSALALGSVAPAFAHETRILPANPGQIRLVVGFHGEPAWEDSFNAIDVILSTCVQLRGGHPNFPGQCSRRVRA